VANQALVVGCDAYPYLAGGDLRGAVADALAVRDWLLSRDGGEVAPGDLTFLASCSAEGAQPGPGIVDHPAERRTFAAAVRDVVAKPDARESDRLFVYLAGHGCRTDPNNPVFAQDAFALTDFSIDDPAAAAGVEELKLQLRQSRFGTIIVFIDACRNYPFETAFQLGSIGTNPKAPQNRPYEPRLFLLQSTLPGRTSQEHQGPAGTVRGDFTVALLNGLQGAGTAKTYDETRDRPYVVGWSSLASYLEAAVPDQQPRRYSEGEIDLASFPDGYFDEVRLTVEVEPGQYAAADGLQIRVGYADPTVPSNPERAAAGPAPVAFTVPPRLQRVVATVGDTWGRCAVDVYEDARVRVPVYVGGPPRRTLKPDATVVRDGNRVAAGAIRIESDDPAAVLQVRDGSGDVALSGVGSAAGRLAPGVYTAVLIGSDGRPRTEPVEIDALAETVIEMTAPGPFSPLTGPQHGGANLPHELRWASDAAVLAWTAGRRKQTGRPALAIAGFGYQPARDAMAQTRGGSAYVQLQDFTPADERQTALAGRQRGWAGGAMWVVTAPFSSVPDDASWLTVTLSRHTLTVPRLPGTCTAIAIGAERLSVGVFDGSALGSPLALALQDRSQALLGAGQRDAAALTAAAALGVVRAGGSLGEADDGLAAAVIRDAAGPGPCGHGLAASADPGPAAGLLPAGPWAVFVDRAAGQPLPIGDLPANGDLPTDAELPPDAELPANGDLPPDAELPTDAELPPDGELETRK
jgi:Caspase domain